MKIYLSDMLLLFYQIFHTLFITEETDGSDGKKQKPQGWIRTNLRNFQKEKYKNVTLAKVIIVIFTIVY